MIIYGRNPVREAIAARRRPVHKVWASKGALKEFGGAQPATNEELTKMAGTDAHQGVCAEVEGYPYVGAAELLQRKDPLLIVLDEIQDPQNLGATSAVRTIAPRFCGSWISSSTISSGSLRCSSSAAPTYG